MKPMHYAFALSAAITVAGFAFTANPAAAANSAMAACNKQWNDATAANSTNGVAFQVYLTACLKKASDAKAAAAPDATMTTAAATTTTAAPVTTAAPADTASAKDKKECGTQWKALTDAGTQGTQKKKDFVAACLAKLAGGATTDAAAAPADTASAKDKKECGVQWKALTDAGTQGTQKKKDFVAACLAKLAAAATTAAAATATAPATATTAAATTITAPATTITKPAIVTVAKPVVPTVAATAATGTAATTTTTVTPPEPTDTTVKTTDKNGKPKTPGQIAMDERIAECGKEWKKAKADPSTAPAIITAGWPKYWSACNKRLKAAAAAN